MENQECIDLTKKYRCEECGAVYTEDDITEDTEVLFDFGEHEQTFHYCPCCGERIVTEDYYFDEDELSRSDIEKEWNSDYMRMAW